MQCRQNMMLCLYIDVQQMILAVPGRMLDLLDGVSNI